MELSKARLTERPPLENSQVLTLERVEEMMAKSNGEIYQEVKKLVESVFGAIGVGREKEYSERKN